MTSFDEKDFQNRVEMFFFSPCRTHNEYVVEYKRRYDPDHIKKYGIRFSPLYLLRQDIFYVSGHNPTSSGPSQFPQNFGPAHFASVILVNLALTNVVGAIFGKNFSSFAKKYMRIEDEKQAKSIRFLRNALEHNSYTLCYRYEEDEKDKQNSKDKLYFRLKIDKDLDFVKLDEEWNRTHDSDMCDVNPLGLRVRAEEAFIELARNLKDESLSIKKRFLEYSRVKDWILLSGKSF